MQKCPAGEGREEAKGLRWGSKGLVLSCPSYMLPDQRRHLELQIEHYGTGVGVEFSLC